jgi:hypothetical protein
VTNVLIDLGEVPGHRDEPAAGAMPRAPVPYRLMLAALSIVLVALLAGSVHRQRPAPPTVIAGRLSDVTFVHGDRLFLVTAGPQLLTADVQNKIVSAYALPGGKLLSRTTVEVSGAIFDVSQADGTLLVSYQVDASGKQATAAVAEGSDRARWRRPAGLVGVSAADGLALLVTDYGRPGEARWSGVDVVTGDERWTVRQPADGYIAPTGYPAGNAVGFPSSLVTVTSAGRLDVRETRTGRITAATAVPAIDLTGNASIWPFADLVLIGAGSAGVTAYGLADLGRRWHSGVDLSLSWMLADCGAVICAFRPQRGMTALDPATGRELWTSDRWAYAEPSGRYLVTTVNEQSVDEPQLWVLDPVSGRIRGDLGKWNGLPTADQTTLTYGMREAGAEYVVWYGVLDPAKLDVRILGSAQRVSNDCQVSAGALICRLVDASVAVWRLR